MEIFKIKFFSTYKWPIIIFLSLLIMLSLSLVIINTFEDGHKKFIEHGLFNTYTLIPFLAFTILLICMLSYYLIINIRSSVINENKNTELKTIEKQKVLITESIKKITKTLKNYRSFIWSDIPYKYKLPWYLVCGAQGCGKTTFINGSGLRIPSITMEDKNIELFEGSKILISDNAIFIDSSGPFIEPEKLPLWEFFLSRLRRFRPVQPINGVILVLDVEIFKQSNQSRISALALEIRDHLLQLQNSIGITPPVYLVFTKIDQLVGFKSFFKGSPPIPTNQVFGLTLPLSKEDDHKLDISFLNKFDTEYDNLIHWQLPRMLERTNQELLPKVRYESFIFLTEMMGLKNNIAYLLEKAFSPSEVDDTILFRGIYFVNGLPLTITTSTQIDYDLIKNSEIDIYSRQSGLFIKDFIEKLILNESGLVGFNEKARRFLARVKVTAFSLMLLILLSMITWLLISYTNNNSLINRFSSAITESTSQLDNYIKKISDKGSIGQIAWTLPFLQSLENIPTGWGDTTPKTPLSERAGLSQRNLLSQAAISAYTISLRRLLLPRLYYMLEEKLTDPQTSESDLYDNLMVYLMFSGSHSIDNKIAIEVIKRDFNSLYSTVDFIIIRNQFAHHVHNLVELGFDPLQKDYEIISSVRNKLKNYSPAQRGFNLLSQLPEIKDLPQFRSQDALGPLGNLAIKRRSGDSLYFYTPGIYTASGFSSVVLAMIPRVAEIIAQEDWVLFNSSENSYKIKNERKLKLASDIRSIYVKNYIENWDNILNDIDFVSFADFKQEIDLLQSLIGPPSPLESLLTAIAKETTTVLEQNKNTDKSKEPEKTTQELSNANQFDNLEARSYINDHYANLHSFVSGTPSGLSELLKGLTTVKSLIGPIVASRSMLSAETGKITANTPLEQAVEQLQGLAVRSPASIEDAINTIVRQTTILLETATRGDVESEWKENIYKFCQRSVNNRFPFSNNKEEVTLSDFVRIFGPDGMIDQFFDRYIKSYVDNSASPWKLLVDTNTKLQISPQALHFFEQAAWIKKVFFPASSKEPRISFGLMPSDLDIKAKGVTIDIGGQSLSYAYGSQQTQTILWPNGNNNVRVNFASTDTNQTKSLSLDGPWALFRLFQTQKIARLSPTRFELDISFSGRYASFIIEAATVDNPFYSNLFRGFRCLPSLVN